MLLCTLCFDHENMKKQMKKQTVEFVSLNVAYRLTEYDTESVTKDYNLPVFFRSKTNSSLCVKFIFTYLFPPSN